MYMARELRRDMVETRCQTGGNGKALDGEGTVKVKYNGKNGMGWAEAAQGKRLLVERTDDGRWPCWLAGQAAGQCSFKCQSMCLRSVLCYAVLYCAGLYSPSAQRHRDW